MVFPTFFGLSLTFAGGSVQAKWLYEEALQRAEERRVKGEGEKERYTQLNVEFQRVQKEMRRPS